MRTLRACDAHCRFLSYEQRSPQIQMVVWIAACARSFYRDLFPISISVGSLAKCFFYAFLKKFEYTVVKYLTAVFGRYNYVIPTAINKVCTIRKFHTCTYSKKYAGCLHPSGQAPGYYVGRIKKVRKLTFFLIRVRFAFCNNFITIRFKHNYAIKSLQNF